jgi:hypothetical protein
MYAMVLIVYIDLLERATIIGLSTQRHLPLPESVPKYSFPFPSSPPETDVYWAKA